MTKNDPRLLVGAFLVLVGCVAATPVFPTLPHPITPASAIPATATLAATLTGTEGVSPSPSSVSTTAPSETPTAPPTVSATALPTATVTRTPTHTPTPATPPFMSPTPLVPIFTLGVITPNTPLAVTPIGGDPVLCSHPRALNIAGGVYTYTDPDRFGIPQNVRSGPGLEFPVIGTIQKDETQPVYWRVDNPDGRHWVSLDPTCTLFVSAGLGVCQDCNIP